MSNSPKINLSAIKGGPQDKKDTPDETPVEQTSAVENNCKISPEEKKEETDKNNQVSIVSDEKIIEETPIKKEPKEKVIKTKKTLIDIDNIKSSKKKEDVQKTESNQNAEKKSEEAPLTIQEEGEEVKTQIKKETKTKAPSKKLSISKTKEKPETKTNDTVIKTEKKSEKIEAVKTSQSHISDASKNEDKSSQENTENYNGIDIKKEQKDNGPEVFSNYESDFKKKESNILKKIKRIKEISEKIQKTNPKFVFGTIGITVVGIFLLFIVAPKYHNITFYKASILNIVSKIQNTQEVENTQETPYVHQDENIPDEITIKEDPIEDSTPTTLIKGGYKITYSTQNNSDDINNQNDSYVLNGNTYSSIDELNLAIEESIADLKKEKIKDSLKNSFVNKLKNSQ